jgi:hypothetical protein
MVPVTCVPWPWCRLPSPSVGSLSGPGVASSSHVAAQLTKSQPRASSTKPSWSSSILFVAFAPLSPGFVANAPWRSGWPKVAPVSTTATVWPAPVDRCHASTTSMSSPGVPPVAPVFWSPQSHGHCGSFVVAWTGTSGSA